MHDDNETVDAPEGFAIAVHADTETLRAINDACLVWNEDGIGLSKRGYNDLDPDAMHIGVPNEAWQGRGEDAGTWVTWVCRSIKDADLPEDDRKWQVVQTLVKPGALDGLEVVTLPYDTAKFLCDTAREYVDKIAEGA